MIVSKAQFSEMIPDNRGDLNEWYSLASEYFDKYEINTASRIAGFMAQAAHESSDFNRLVENMNYSQSGLRKIFGRYFPTDAMAAKYARKPEEIANIVYNDANRINKLGNTQPGDGWRFIGRGIFQLSGRWNYEDFGRDNNMTPEEVAEYSKTRRGAMHTACWFWNERDCNRHADKGDIVGMSRAINGGDIGLSDRIAKWNRNSLIVKRNDNPTRTLTIGSKGQDVKNVQTVLKIGADGFFGKNTNAAVVEWQKAHGYSGQFSEDQQRKMLYE
jgi:putative chitinase